MWFTIWPHICLKMNRTPGKGWNNNPEIIFYSLISGSSLGWLKEKEWRLDCSIVRWRTLVLEDTCEWQWQSWSLRKQLIVSASLPQNSVTVVTALSLQIFQVLTDPVTLHNGQLYQLLCWEMPGFLSSTMFRLTLTLRTALLRLLLSHHTAVSSLVLKQFK